MKSIYRQLYNVRTREWYCPVSLSGCVIRTDRDFAMDMPEDMAIKTAARLGPDWRVLRFEEEPPKETKP